MRKALFALLGIVGLFLAYHAYSATLYWKWESYAGTGVGQNSTAAGDTVAILNGAQAKTSGIDTSRWFPLFGIVEYGDEEKLPQAIGDSICVTIKAKATASSDSVRFTARLQTSEDKVTLSDDTFAVGTVDAAVTASTYAYVGFGFSPFGLATVRQDSGGVVPGYEQTAERFKENTPLAKYGRFLWTVGATNAYATDSCRLSDMTIRHINTTGSR